MAVFATSLLAALVAGVVSPIPASASISCTSGGNSQVGGWRGDSDGQVAGIEAPIQFRQDGETCQGGSGAGGGESVWIGIESGSTTPPYGNSLVQIGILHYYDVNTQLSSWCGFWEVIVDGFPSPPSRWTAA
jgi:hypothetical protein